MLSSSKANEIAIIGFIENKINDAAHKGEFKISIGNDISDNARQILIDSGYSIAKLNSNGIYRYDISWEK